MVRLSDMSTSTWLALVGGAALATASGMVTGWQTNRLGMKRDKLAQESQRELARDALAQERLDRTYTELGIYLSHFWDWAKSVHPPIGTVPAPEPVPDEERWRIETLVENHASAEVRRLLDLWGQQLGKIRDADAMIQLADGSRSPSSELDQDAQHEKKAIEMDYRPAMLKAAKAIREQMNRELTPRTEASPAPQLPQASGQR
jgi:hypothetical protein